MDTAEQNKGILVKVTRLGNVWGVRVYNNTKVFMEGTVKDRAHIGDMIRTFLRWVDKQGFDSPMASASRMRQKPYVQRY